MVEDEKTTTTFKDIVKLAGLDETAITIVAEKNDEKIVETVKTRSVKYP